MPARRVAAALFLCALVPTLVVALPAVGASAADPHPVAPTIHSLTLQGVDAKALTAARLKPAAAATATPPGPASPPAPRLLPSSPAS